MACFSVSGSPPSAYANSGGQLQEKHTTMTRRTDSYLPVPGEEKNLEMDFISKAKSGESMVRNGVLVIFWKMKWFKQSIDFFSLFPIHLCLRKSLQCSFTLPKGCSACWTGMNQSIFIALYIIFHFLPVYLTMFWAFSQTNAHMF